ncbi:MAG: bacillithiol biosynthesis protein BshC, partial [Longimicrobiales bacterium]
MNGPATAVAGLEIVVEPLASELVRDLLAGADRLAPFYAGHPHDPAAYRRKADAVAARLGPESRQAVAEAVQPTSAAAASKWERIVRGEGVVVTTGQQAGLFGGPLYTVHKVLTAVRLAETLEAELQLPVAPLFWVASDDHDWAEVDHTAVIDARNELRRVTVEAAPDSPPIPM